MFLLIINSRSEEIYCVSNLVFISCQPSDQFVLFMPLIKLFNTPGFKLMLAKFLLIGHQDSWMRGRGSGIMPALPAQARGVECSDLRDQQSAGRLSRAPRQVMRVTNSFKLEIKAYPGVLS